MMLLEGADLYLKNGIGQSPLFLCPSDITDVLRTVIEKCGYVCISVDSYCGYNINYTFVISVFPSSQGSYHGSLRKFSISLPKLKRVKFNSLQGFNKLQEHLLLSWLLFYGPELFLISSQSKLESAAMASGGDIVKRFPSKDLEKGQHSDRAEKGPKLSPPGERRDKQTPESPASVHAKKGYNITLYKHTCICPAMNDHEKRFFCIFLTGSVFTCRSSSRVSGELSCGGRQLRRPAVLYV